MKIEIMEYNPDWTKNFEEEKIKLLRFFGSHAVAIEHIGSTAIPNQRAKPVIDIFIGVSPFAELTFYQRIFNAKEYHHTPTDISAISKASNPVKSNGSIPSMSKPSNSMRALLSAVCHLK